MFCLMVQTDTLTVSSQQEGFAQNHGQGLIAFEGQEQAGGRVGASGNNAQVLVIGFHQDVA